jgi:photolyase PhrII
MRTAVRGHENPALDVALTLANARGVPLLVYHALSERYPYASDRHHTFILQGARDAMRELRARRVPYAFHLERPGHRGPHLRTLAEKAVAVVTEDFPVAPLRAWTEALAKDVLVVAVDTACVVPTKLVARAYERAFAYEKATRGLRAERLRLPWVDVEPARPMVCPELPFEPVDLETADLAALVASAEIDHSVGPVASTVGGSAAGYARFAAFLAHGLARYGRDRNDPLLDGVSRMSPYLHYGHVSPMRLAREVEATGGAGARKYLDELLVWRELAYAFCAHRPSVDTLEALPDWARATLAAHAADARPMMPSWETLARGTTGDALWDAAQASLRVHGELHNNVRMTWGKALVEWTRDPAGALATLLDLNHRFALDGRDPASYGGLLWCLGQFDRPFTPERPVLGTVRGRSPRDHARRLDVPVYAARMAAPSSKPMRVVVVGAGLAGLACARTLADHNLEVVVLDKGRTPGGRASGRREGGRVFDHGAQFFTARSEWLTRHVRSWEADGVVARWAPRVVQTGGARPRGDATWWVGAPDMGALAAHLAKGLDVRQSVKVTRIERHSEGEWRLHADAHDVSASASAHPAFAADAVVVTCPAAQTATLLAPVHADFAAAAAAVPLTPCWAVMLAVEGAGDLGADVLEDGEGAVRWAARDTSKPGRSVRAGVEQWVLHASPSWSLAHLEDEPEDVGEALARNFLCARGLGRSSCTFVDAHRWRFARGHQGKRESALFDPTLALAVCGDGWNGSRIEGALTSGVAAAGRLLGLAAER